jgi:hypothetical protein
MQALVQVSLTSTICAGSYHLWYVQANAQHRSILGIKRIYVTYPSCY